MGWKPGKKSRKFFEPAVLALVLCLAGLLLPAAGGLARVSDAAADAAGPAEVADGDSAVTAGGAADGRPVVVMLGDSLTAGGVWAPLNPGARIVNLGVSGDGCEDVLDRLDAVVVLKPDLVVLQVGVNDLAGSGSPEDIVGGHEAIWRELRRALPEARLVVCSLLPMGWKWAGGRGPEHYNRRIRQVNRLLQKAAEDEGLPFLDLYAAMADLDDNLPDFATYDGLHLSPKGYAIWYDVVGPRLRRF
ncbi:MAG: GDSL-type esterase/lipase family protein [Deltaproteobacteria bacterium]|jgi:lysophospholipase L1-like esterase|nr:GDSL-type esterase/lipase family protein [Deltaproteobacteria bacterium]